LLDDEDVLLPVTAAIPLPCLVSAAVAVGRAGASAAGGAKYSANILADEVVQYSTKLVYHQYPKTTQTSQPYPSRLDIQKKLSNPHYFNQVTI
jgi:hypothetical protein